MSSSKVFTHASYDLLVNETIANIKKLSTLKGGEYAGDTDGCPSFLLYSPSGTRPWREVNELAKAKGWKLRELGDRPLTLEETFLRLTERAGQAAGRE